MADLNFKEKAKFEKLLRMESGYVLVFSNAKLKMFVAESVGKDIYSDTYAEGSGSKAARLRRLWNKEPNHIVGKLLMDLLEQWTPIDCTPVETSLFDECEKIAKRLLANKPVESLDAITAVGPEREFDLIVSGVRASIAADKPEAGLDRLHTYAVKLVRF